MNLADPVESLKGIGPKTAETLKKAGIKTVRDFFYNLPRDYENYQAATTIAEMRPGKVVVKGEIEKLTSRRARKRNLSIIEGVIKDKTGEVKVVWFNQSYRMRQFVPERESMGLIRTSHLWPETGRAREGETMKYIRKCLRMP